MMIFYAKFSISFLNSPPCQTFVKLLNHIIFQDTGSKSVRHSNWKRGALD